jgi:DNA-directed RNA polymerase subunit F
MLKPKVVSESPISMAAIKAELERIKERDSELNFRGQKTEEYLQQFVKLSKEDAEELSKKIESLNVPRLKAEHISKIIDVMPANVEDLKIVLQGYSLAITNDNFNKISEAVAEYAKK